MLLFKYALPERLDILANLEIRFTQISEFNDPFEMVPHFSAVGPHGKDEAMLNEFGNAAPEVASNVLQSMLTRHHLTIEQFASRLTRDGFPISPSDLRDPSDVVRRILKQLMPTLLELLRSPAFAVSFQASLSRRFGVLSLSEVPSSLLMWAHYAACHRGIVIGFDSSHAFFQQAPELARLRKVAYSNERTPITLYDLSVIDDEYTAKAAQAILFSKSFEWQYEREWRMVMPLDKMEQFPHRVVDKRYHLFGVPADAINCVVIGARADESLASGVRTLLLSKKRLSHVTVHRAHISGTKFELVLDPPITAL